MNDSQRPEMNSSLGIARFGEVQENQLREFVEGVVRSTKLWRSEKNEVRLELTDHLNDGADAGRSLEQLIQDFGSPQVAARLIRKAKIRNRPWSWHVWYRTFQFSAACIFIALGGVLLLLARLHLARSGPRTDEVGNFDRQNAKIAVADRGWPEYREGLVLLDRTPLKAIGKTEGLDLMAVPTDPQWARVIQYLDANAKSVALFLKAAERPRLGYIYRDPTNDPWLSIIGNRPSAEIYPLNEPRDGILLPHYQDLGYVRNLFQASALKALENKDLPEFRRYRQAQANLGRQILAESEFIVVQSIGRASVGCAMSLLRHLVIDYSELLSDEALQTCRQQLDSIQVETTISGIESLRLESDHFLQSIYSPEASGGRLTAFGCQTLRRHLSYVPPDESLRWTALLKEKEAAGLPRSVGRAPQRPSAAADAINQELIALRWATTLAPLAEMRVERDRLLGLLKAELDKPLALCREDFEGSDYGKELQRLATNPDQLRRYWPLLLSLPSRDLPYWPERNREILTMSREATLASVALEQYRRRVGEWPDRLEQLVPADLPRVPQDIFSGRPLNYRVVDGKPLMYSFFRDRDDDGGEPFPNSAVGFGPHDGDLRLLPAR